MYLMKMNLRKLQTFDSSLFYWSKLLFQLWRQLYVIFQLLYYTLKVQAIVKKLYHWKSKGLLAEKLTTPFANTSLSPI